MMGIEQNIWFVLLVISSMSRPAWWFPYICIFRWLEATSSWAVGTCTGNMRIIMYIRIFMCHMPYAYAVYIIWNVMIWIICTAAGMQISQSDFSLQMKMFFVGEVGNVQSYAVRDTCYKATRCMIVAPSCGRWFFKKRHMNYWKKP